MPVITKFLDRRTHGSSKIGSKPKPKSRQSAMKPRERMQENSRGYERARSNDLVKAGVPRIPERLRKYMEAGGEPTEEMEAEMAPFIAAACERFQAMHFQDMRSRKFLHTETRRRESDGE